MSQFSETMGSFTRTGNYPLEGNYIFPTEDSLKEFYNDPINKTTLHNGLLKIVLGDKLTLYWVTTNKTTNELEFKILISEDSIENLLNKIQDLKNDTKNNLDEIRDQLQSIIDYGDAIIALQNKDLFLDDIIAKIIGSNSDNLIEYLDTLDYNSITKISEVLSLLFDVPDFSLLKIIDMIREVKTTSEYTDSNLQTELNLTLIGVGLDSSGLFSPDQETKYLKNATSIMNALKILDLLIANINGKNSIIENAYYESETEKIVMVFKLNEGNTQTIEIPASDLISEWEVVNNIDSAVTLSKERIINGADRLSADVRINANPYNLLTKSGNALLVDGSNLLTKSDLEWYEG